MIKVKRICLLLVVVLAVFFMFGIAVPSAVEASTEREEEIEKVRAAIRALPSPIDITEADRPAVLEAQRLANEVIAKYNMRAIELCTLSGKLNSALDKLGLERLGTADAAPVALPETGGFSSMVPMGLLSVFAGTALLISYKRSR